MLERTLRAAQLLSEALVILGHGRAPLSAPPTRRGSDRLLRLPEVQRLTGLCRSTIYQQMQRGTFPRSVKMGPRAVSWSEAAVQAWIADRLDGRTPGETAGP
jgi:prophage regulatory protein